MSANLGARQGGRGGEALANAKRDDLTEEDYRALSASDGLSSLTGDFAQVKPDLDDPGEFPGPIAEALYWDDSTIVGIQGPVGSGKTTTLLKSRLRRAKMMPRSVLRETRHGIEGHWRLYKLLVIRATYRQLWSTTIPDFLGTFPKDLGDWSGGRGGPVTFVMIFEDEFGPIEFVCEFMAFGDDIVGSMRGYQTTDIWLHEMDTNPVDVLANGITRIKRHPKQEHFRGYAPHQRSYGQIVGDFNAPDEDNYCFRLFHDAEERARIVAEMNRTLPEDSPPIAVTFHHQPGYGQPGCENLHNLPVGYYEGQIAALTLAGKGDLIERLVRNKVTYLREGEPVFQREFSRRIHVAEAPLEPWPGCALRIGLDQGFKGAAVVVQFKPPFHWQILAELHFPAERLMAHTFGERLRDLIDQDPRLRGLRIEGAWADMAGEHGASQAADENMTWNLLVGQAAGFVVLPQRIGTNRLQPRLEQVRAALEFIHGGQPGLLIDPSCRFVIRGFEARYVWAEEIDASGDRRKVPNKRLTEANVHDALQYVLLSEAKPQGLSPLTTPGSASAQIGHNGGPPMQAPGLTTDFDTLQPL